MLAASILFIVVGIVLAFPARFDPAIRLKEWAEKEADNKREK